MMFNPNAHCHSAIKTGIFIFAAAIILSACGGGGSGSGNATRNSGGTPSYTVGGSISSLNGTLVLQNGNDQLSLDGSKVNFTFATSLKNGDPYHVTVVSQPAGQQCAILGGGAGTIDNANVSVSVGCFPDLNLATHSLSKSVRLIWNDTGAGSSYTIYYAPTPCDINQVKSCTNLITLPLADGTFTTNSTNIDSFDVTGLSNGQNYYFYMEASEPGGYQTSSAGAGARPDSLVLDNTVNAIATDSSGNIYLGGDFNHVGAKTGIGYVMDANHSGSLRGDLSPLVDGVYIHAVATDGNGGWYIGGLFTQVGGLPRQNLAHILADGSVDPNWAPSTDAEVSGITVDGNVVYVGGYFTKVNNTSRNYVAAIKSDGTLLPWDPNPNQPVHGIAISGGNVYIGGEFTAIAGGNRNALAAVTSDASATLLPWDPDADGYVQSLLANGGIIYAFGGFTHLKAGSKKRQYLAAINTDSAGTINSWDPEPNYYVESFAISNNTLYVAGDFTQFGPSTTRNYLVSLSLATTNPETSASVSPWNPNANGIVTAVTATGTTVYVAGNFTTIAGVNRDHAAAISMDTGATPLPWNPILSGSIYSLANYGNTVYAGGYNNTIGSIVRHHLLEIRPDESLLPWNPDVGGTTIKALAIDSSGIVYAGGLFQSIGGASVTNMARIGSDGTLQPWYPNPDGEVDSIALIPGVAFIGGKFSAAGSTNNIGLAAINSANFGIPLQLDTTFSTSSQINALTVSGNTLYVGGTFNYSGDTTSPQANLAALDTAITTDAKGQQHIGALNPVFQLTLSGTTLSGGSVNALLANGNTLYTGGNFTASNTSTSTATGTITTITQPNLAAVNLIDGSLLTTVPPVTGIVNAFAYNGGIVYAGGNLSTMNTTNLLGAGAFDSTGAVYNWNPVYSGTVNAIVANGTSIYIGGHFNDSSSQAPYYFAIVPQ